MELREYQKGVERRIKTAWSQGAKNVLAVMPTGAGKTVLFAKIAAEQTGPVCCIAHRQELVGQMSLALGRFGVPHRVIGPVNVVKFVVRLHMTELGRSYYDPGAPVAVAGVDTIRARRDALGGWLADVNLWIMDESHHILLKNKWGAAVALMPNARGLGVTATPVRADGHGLGSHADGVFDTLVNGPELGELILEGWLTQYKVICPGPGVDVKGVELGATGDFKKPQLKAALERQPIVGSIVDEYLKHARGRLGVTFCVDVDEASKVAREFCARGVPAEVVSHKTPDAIRFETIQRFRRREILQLVNVDLFGEGFDLPALEVVSFARPTESFALYMQQFGRALRVMLDPGAPQSTRAERLDSIARSRKPKALIIDHVHNVVRHLPPDKVHVWSLDRRDRRGRLTAKDDIPLRICLECTQPYERIFTACPYCGAVPVPAERTAPEYVDGDLVELDPATLAQLRGEASEVWKDKEIVRDELTRRYVPHVGVLAGVKRHVTRQAAHDALRRCMAYWGGSVSRRGYSDREAQRLFYFRFGVDVLTAQTLKTRDAYELAERVALEL
jgi:superfamily II DNA or RNA helicase